LSTVTVAPGLTESGVAKLKLLIVMVEAVLPASEDDDEAEDDDEPVVAPEDDEEPDEPQATRVTAHRPTRTIRGRACVPDMSRPLCGRVTRGTATRHDPALGSRSGSAPAPSFRPDGVPSQCAAAALRSSSLMPSLGAPATSREWCGLPRVDTDDEAGVVVR
jgi:hypothetical protein